MKVIIGDYALEQLKSLDNSVRERIIKFLVERVQEHPDALLLAKPLVGEFKGL